MAGRFSVEAIFKAVDKITGPVNRMQAGISRMTGTASKNLAALDGSMSKITGGLARGAIGVAKFGAAVIAGAGAATVAAINNVEQAASALVDRADRLQFPIEALQEWQFAAEQSGMGVDEFDKALEKFNKNLGDVKMGVGELQGKLSKKGPTQLAGILEKLKNAKGVSEALEIYTTALAGIKDPAIKASLAVAAFGKSGAKMVNVVNLGADGIAALRAEQRENGVLTDENARAIEAYGDAMNSFKRSIGGLIAGVLGPLFPMLGEIVSGWRAWIVANKDMIRSGVLSFFEGVRKGVSTLIDAVTAFSAKYDLPGLIGATIDKLMALGGFLKDNAEFLTNLAIAFGAVSLAVKAMNIVMGIANAIASTNPWLLLAAGLIVLIVWIYSARDSIAQFGRDVMAWFSQLSPVVHILAIVVGGVAAAFGVVMGVMWAVNAATVAYAAVVAALNGALLVARVGVMLFNFALAANPIGAIILAVTVLIGLAALLIANWDSVAKFFTDLWSKIGGIVDKIAAAMGFGDTITVKGEAPKPGAGEAGGPAATGAAPAAQVVTPADRIAGAITETRNTSTSEVTIKDTTGKAEVTGGKLGPGLKLQKSGAF
jgi:hypothetical protein